MGENETIEPLKRLTRDLKKASATLSTDEARYLVDAYYQLQRDRIRGENQVRALTTPTDPEQPVEPHETIAWFAQNTALLESQIKRALDAYGDAHLVGRWAKSIVGIGPVISAGLLAHINIEKAPTAGHIWRFAGLDPTSVWGKGQKRPWNAQLKTLCWKIGESFVKVSNRDGDVYGHLYVTRKAYETAKNDAGDYADQAKTSLTTKKFGADTEARKHYEVGKLPPGRIHARAKRWAVKLFLNHYQMVAYRDRYGVDAPRPYVLDVLGHADAIQVPNWPF